MGWLNGSDLIGKESIESFLNSVVNGQSDELAKANKLALAQDILSSAQAKAVLALQVSAEDIDCIKRTAKAINKDCWFNEGRKCPEIITEGRSEIKNPELVSLTREIDFIKIADIFSAMNTVAQATDKDADEIKATIKKLSPLEKKMLAEGIESFGRTGDEKASLKKVSFPNREFVRKFGFKRIKLFM